MANRRKGTITYLASTVLPANSLYTTPSMTAVPPGATGATFTIAYTAAGGAAPTAGPGAVPVIGPSATTFGPIGDLSQNGTKAASNIGTLINGSHSLAVQVDLRGGEAFVGCAVREAGDSGHPGTVVITLSFGG
jgi:hypothetical protein